MEKHKTIWTTKEENDLCQEIRLGQSIEKIAKSHQRTEKAIEMRLASIFKKRLEKGEKMNVLTNDFNLSEKQIKHYMNDLEENKKKFENTKSTGILPKESNSIQDIFSKLQSIEKYLTLIEKRLDKIEQINSHIYKNLKKTK